MPPNAVALLLITLVPIIPAAVTFKLLPSTAEADGPLQGLKIKLTGAFCGYFLIFLTLIGIRGNFEGPGYQQWSVQGTIVLSDSLSDAPTTPLYIDARYVKFSVPSITQTGPPNLSFYFIRNSNGQPDSPVVSISLPGYGPQSFWLGPQDQKPVEDELWHSFNSANRTVDLGQITLVKLPATEGNPYPKQPQEAQP
jgi:hypothetical protein